MQNTLTLTVSQLNEYVKALLDSSDILGNIYIKGEISNFKNHYQSGHLYFSLKDEASVLKVVMFRSSAIRLKFMPENGMKVIVRGRISVYTCNGEYQLYAEEISPDGIGELYLAYEQLKEKLEIKGLFDTSHKKPIPKYPNKIGIITAPSGAAVADMKNIISRRYPLTEIIIYPSLVQGSGAPAELASGIRYFNRSKCVDTVIIGRGGGSLEDLWAFNSEMLAYEIYESSIPVISAVGHETDFTICDFVSDLRAPTPSAAAELAVPNISDISSTLKNLMPALKLSAEQIINARRAQLSVISKNKMLENPYFYTDRLRNRTETILLQINNSAKNLISVKKGLLSEKAARISALSPLSVMARGYAIIIDENGKTVPSAQKLSVGETVQLRFSKGTADAKITQIKKGAVKNARKKEN